MDFGRLWNFHNTLGAVDDKHVALKAHNKSESMSYNYKGFFSVVVMAVVDARYRFIFVDAHACRKQTRKSVFRL